MLGRFSRACALFASGRGSYNDWRASRGGLRDLSQDERLNVLRELAARPLPAERPDPLNIRAHWLLASVLRTLGIEPTQISPITADDLGQDCLYCPHARRCMRELANGSAATAFTDYCPNAEVLMRVRARQGQTVTWTSP